MQTTSCPWCNSLLQNVTQTQVCSTCGKTLHSDAAQPAETSEPDPDHIANNQIRRIQSYIRRFLPTLPHFSRLRNGLSLWNKDAAKKHIAERMAFSTPLTLDPLDEEQTDDELQDPSPEDNDISELRPDGQLTWKKVVEPSPHRQTYTYPPRPPVPEDERSPGGGVAIARVLQSSITLPTFKKATSSKLRQVSPGVVFWVSIAILLITIGLFSVASTLGRGKTSTTNIDNHLSLQITPNELSVGAIMMLRGNHFSPHASIGLTRDTAIPLTDTSGTVLTQADATGEFTDTIIVGNDWGAGTHVITAEDSLSHKVASFPIMIDGKGASLRPPHLHLSVNALDFGTGDQATNSTRTLTLLNSGNSEITWQESTSQPWLLMTPTQGTFTHDISQQVTIAVDRSKLTPGPYSAQVNFSSNGGNESLAVAMNVTPLQAGQDAIMQISPAVLSFTAADGSNTTPSQQISVSNSGGQVMNWRTATDVPWLNVSPSSMAVAPGTFTNANVSIATRNLLPGTYTGTLTFTAQNSTGNGNAFHSPQQVVVSITITPPCTLAVTPGMLNFSSAYLQPAPPAKTVALAASPGCAAPLNWNATSNTAWLKLNSTHGTTPGTLSIGVDVAGLTPNTYTGTITLSSPASTQTVVATLMLGQAGSAVISAGPPSLVFTSVAGQSGPGAQTVLLSNTGGGMLNWQANAIPNLNANWLQVTPASGTLSSHQSIALTVSVTSSTVLASGNYNGTISLTGNNGAGQNATGNLQSIPISYTIRPACTLQAPSTTMLDFSTIVGTNPASQSFSIGVTGACDGGAKVIPTLTTTDGGNWLSVSPPSTTITSGGSVTFTVNVDASAITANQHNGTIALRATLNGSNVAGGPRNVNVALTAIAPPFLVATPATINFNVPGGSTSAPINLANTGGSPLNWIATLPDNAPAFVSLSATSGSNVVGGANVSFNVVINPKGVASGLYQTNVTISASNAANGLPVTGNGAVIPINIQIAQPVMQVNTTNVSFSGLTKSSIDPQSISIANTGGGILSWMVSSPTQPWLSISTTTGRTAMGTSSTLVFSVRTNSMSANSTPYTDQVIITPAVGNPITINIYLTLTDPDPTPTPTATPNSIPTPTATSASPTAIGASPTAISAPTAINTSPTPTSAPTAIPSPTPTTFVSLPMEDVRIFSGPAAQGSQATGL